MRIIKSSFSQSHKLCLMILSQIRVESSVHWYFNILKLISLYIFLAIQSEKQKNKYKTTIFQTTMSIKENAHTRDRRKMWNANDMIFSWSQYLVLRFMI